MASWQGPDRRSGKERRRGERRQSVRYTADTLLIIDGITWIDNEGTDRRRKVRRKVDRERVARTILGHPWFTES
ncbi:MAG TPA: hypothetical protein VKF81_09525 [Blastocatellia bacterium]|nr:hypothetical protein [Blastocatellia bacterium]